jgi:hypothetical protein
VRSLSSNRHDSSSALCNPSCHRAIRSSAPALPLGHYATPPPSPPSLNLPAPGMGSSLDGRYTPRSGSVCTNSSRSQTPVHAWLHRSVKQSQRPYASTLCLPEPPNHPHHRTRSRCPPIPLLHLRKLYLRASAIRGSPCESSIRPSSATATSCSVRCLSAGWCPRRNDEQVRR